MDRTAELRWFFPENAPPPVVSWFEANADAPQARSDVYLVLPGTDALGVKVRGATGRLEIKLRPRPPSSLAIAGTTGGLEEWQRWSLPRPALSRLLPTVGLPRKGWVEVGKSRRRTTIPFRADAGCRIELTTLLVRSERWATVGFESFGPEADLVPALRAAADEFFGSVELPGGLRATLSCGYPGWLATL